MLATSVASLQRTEIEKMHMAIERRQHVMRQRDGDGRLADPAGASERNEAVAQQASRQFLQNVLPSDHPLQPVWQRRPARLFPVTTGGGDAGVGTLRCTGATKQ